MLRHVESAARLTDRFMDGGRPFDIPPPKLDDDPCDDPMDDPDDLDDPMDDPSDEEFCGDCGDFGGKVLLFSATMTDEDEGGDDVDNGDVVVDDDVVVPGHSR